MSTEKKPTIKVQDVLALLKKGYTRYAKDDAGYGSIQNHYGLTGVQVKELFNHTKLKARKTILPKAALTIIDEDEMVETEAAEPIPPSAIIEETVQDALVELGNSSEPQESSVVETISKEELFS